MIKIPVTALPLSLPLLSWADTWRKIKRGAAATTEAVGSAVSSGAGKVTDKGLMLTADLMGTKYWKDDGLNSR